LRRPLKFATPESVCTIVVIWTIPEKPHELLRMVLVHPQALYQIAPCVRKLHLKCSDELARVLHVLIQRALFKQERHRFISVTFLNHSCPTVVALLIRNHERTARVHASVGRIHDLIPPPLDRVNARRQSHLVPQ